MTENKQDKTSPPIKAEFRIGHEDLGDGHGGWFWRIWFFPDRGADHWGTFRAAPNIAHRSAAVLDAEQTLQLLGYAEGECRFVDAN